MDDWAAICTKLSSIFESNKHLNFDIRLSPEEVSNYMTDKVLFARVNGLVPEDIEAALFVTHDGECGFIALEGVKKSSYEFLIKEFHSFVIQLPDELRSNLWCRTQRNNKTAQRLIKRLGITQHSQTDKSYYYKLGGNN